MEITVNGKRLFRDEKQQIFQRSDVCNYPLQEEYCNRCRESGRCKQRFEQSLGVSFYDVAGLKALGVDAICKRIVAVCEHCLYQEHNSKEFYKHIDLYLKTLSGLQRVK